MFKTKPRTEDRRALLYIVFFAMLASVMILVGLTSQVIDLMFGGGWTLAYLVVATLTTMLVGASPAMSKFAEWFMVWERKPDEHKSTQ